MRKSILTQGCADERTSIIYKIKYDIRQAGGRIISVIKIHSFVHSFFVYSFIHSCIHSFIQISSFIIFPHSPTCCPHRPHSRPRKKMCPLACIHSRLPPCDHAHLQRGIDKISLARKLDVSPASNQHCVFLKCGPVSYTV